MPLRLRRPFPLSRPRVASLPTSNSGPSKKISACGGPSGSLRRCGTGGCGTKLAASPCLATPAGTNTSSSTCPVARPLCCTAVERSRARTRVHARGVNAVLALRSVRVPPAKPPAHTRPPYVPPDASLCNSCGGPLKNSPPAAGLAVCDGGGGRCELAPCCGCHNTPPPAALPIPRCA